MKRFILSAFSFFAFINLSIAQNNYIYPLNIPATLSANFGELRANHFHSGIDLKTQGVVNKPVQSVEDGYVSRISISGWGYGLALYIDHPNGQTTVYGHLNKYAPKIEKFITQKQYEKERYMLNVHLSPNDIPVQKGEVVAYSGNTGSSFGPHVHFEVRETANQRIIDPLVFFKNKLKDTTAPQVRGIAIYPKAGEGTVNQSANIFRRAVTRQKDGSHSPMQGNIQAWGKIATGIYAIDKMNDTHNIYGVKLVKLHCNNELIFSSDIESFLFSETRMINSLTDFNHWKESKAFYMKSFIEPGNKLTIYNSVKNNGYVNIDEEKTYTFKYELEDIYGNKTTYSFVVEGKEQTIPEQAHCSQYMVWDRSNHFEKEDFRLNIPAKRLYDNIGFTLLQEETENYLSDIYTINDSYVPLDDYASMHLKMKIDTLSNKGQYGIIELRKGKEYWIGGSYNAGYMSAEIRELGNTYVVGKDEEAPIITAINKEKWVTTKKVAIKATDNLSGVKTYRGTIDGNFVLFSHDGKSPTYHYTFDDKLVKAGNEHILEFTVIDLSGNESIFSSSFTY